MLGLLPGLASDLRGQRTAARGSFEPGPSKLQSPPLRFTLASNQVERMGRRGCNPAAGALFLWLLLLLFSLCQAQGVTVARQAPQANHGGREDGRRHPVPLQRHPNIVDRRQAPPGPSRWVPTYPTAPTRAPSPVPCTYKRRTQPGAGSGGVFADERLSRVSSLSSPASLADEPGNLRGVFAINKCKHLCLNSSSWS